MSTTKRRAVQPNAAHLLRGGKAVPKSLVHRCLADLQARSKAQLEKRFATERKLAKLLGEISPPRVDQHLPARSTDGLLDFHRKFAKQKVLAPAVSPHLGGLMPGRVTATIVPPFDYDIVLDTVLAGPQPTLEASSDRLTGKMSASAITATQKGFNGGSMYTTVGIYFHPMSAGTLTFRATPTYSFQWWTNSIGANSLVRSFGSAGLTIYGVDVASQTTGEVGTIVSTASTRVKLWDETQTDQVRFDFGFDIPAPATVELDVSRTLVYLLFVDADVHVEGVGWVGSLAGAKMSVSVPSITYDFQLQQVFES